MGLIKEVRERRLIPFMGAFLVTGFVALEGVDQLISHEILPAVAYPITLVFYVFGVLGSLTFAWYHGEKGRQETTRGEVFIHATLFVLALATSAYVARSTLAAEEQERMRLAGLEQLSPTEDPRRIAVMYFEDRSPDGELAYLADGLTETLIDELSQIEALHVVSRNGSRLYRGSGLSLDSISQALQVGTLVEGTVAESGDQLRVSVQMIDAASGKQVGSRRLERSRDELFVLLDDLSLEMSLFLREQLGEEIAILQVTAGTSDTEAWATVQQARQVAELAQELGAAGDFSAASTELLRADSLLDAAESLDDQWLTPVTERGWVAYRQARLGGFDRSHYAEWIERGIGHAQQALLREPTDADARELRGTLQYWRYLLNLAENPDEAEELRGAAEADLRAAVDSEPDRASAWASLSHLLAAKSDIAGGKLAALRSYEVDPYLANADVVLWRLFQMSMDLEDDVEARNWCEEGQRRFAESFRFVECQIMIQSLKGQQPNIDHAWQLLERYMELSPAHLKEFNRNKGEMLIAMALARAGQADSARALAERARADATVDPVRELAYIEAIVRTWLEEYDEALRLLGVFLAANPGQRESVARDQTWYLTDLRAQPGFSSLVTP